MDNIRYQINKILRLHLDDDNRTDDDFIVTIDEILEVLDDLVDTECLALMVANKSYMLTGREIDALDRIITFLEPRS